MNLVKIDPFTETFTQRCSRECLEPFRHLQGVRKRDNNTIYYRCTELFWVRDTKDG